jgi:hypothetical protein
MVNLSSDYIDCTNAVDRLLELEQNIMSVRPEYSRAVAEVLMLRLFDVLIEWIHTASVKMVCGACYLDGSHPRVLVPARSKISAINSMITYGRVKPRGLRWSQVSEIKENVENVLDLSEHFYRELENHGILISEMKAIRNRIAHNNTNSKAAFKNIVVKYYGAGRHSVTPGMLLLTARQEPILIEQYLRKTKLLIRVLGKG